MPTVLRSSCLFILFLIAGCGNMPGHFKSELAETYSNPENSDLKRDSIKFRFINVGQGDATLITTSNGNSILLDAGMPEIGRERVLPLLVDADLELIIASHYDSDHIGGIPEVIKGVDGIIGTDDDTMPARGVLDRGQIDAIDTPVLSDYFIISSDMRFSLEAGDVFVIEGVVFTILAENGLFKDGYSEKVAPENENALSISILITYGGVSYLTSGDLPGPNFTNQYEPYDLESHIAGLAGKVDILHVSHHGSHNSTSRSFVEATSPDIAIISVGENDYGHPHHVVIDNLLGNGAVIYLTEGDWIDDKTGLNIMNGDICLETDGENIVVGRCEEY